MKIIESDAMSNQSSTVTTFDSTTIDAVRALHEQGQENASDRSVFWEVLTQELAKMRRSHPDSVHVRDLSGIITPRDIETINNILSATQLTAAGDTQQQLPGLTRLEALITALFTPEQLADMSAVELRGTRILTQEYLYPKADVHVEFTRDGDGIQTTIILTKLLDSRARSYAPRFLFDLHLTSDRLEFTVDSQLSGSYPITVFQELGLGSITEIIAHEESQLRNFSLESDTEGYQAIKSELQALHKSLAQAHRQTSADTIWNDVQLKSHSHDISAIIQALEDQEPYKGIVENMRPQLESVLQQTIRATNKQLAGPEVENMKPQLESVHQQTIRAANKQLAGPEEIDRTINWKRVWQVIEGTGLVAAFFADFYFMKEAVIAPEDAAAMEFLYSAIIFAMLIWLTAQRNAHYNKSTNS